MRYSFPLLLAIILLSGCNARHITEIMRLQDVAANQEEQVRSIRAANKHFDALLAAMRDKSIETYKTKEDFLKYFGEPIFIKPCPDNPEYVEFWLYRYAEDFWKSDKIYIYFDAQGKIVKWEYQPPPAQEQKS